MNRENKGIVMGISVTLATTFALLYLMAFCISGMKGQVEAKRAGMSSHSRSFVARIKRNQMVRRT